MAMENEITLKLTPEQLNIIWAGLNELPVKVALKTMQDIERQIKLIHDAGQSNITPLEG